MKYAVSHVRKSVLVTPGYEDICQGIHKNTISPFMPPRGVLRVLGGGGSSYSEF